MNGGFGRRATPAEQHLGDRLAALVDGELEHETRERVLAHLATCATCKAEADAQRRVKSVFAGTAPPPPSDGLLARLQGLPGGADDGDRDRGPGGPAKPSPTPWDLGGLPSAGALPPDRGFRIHEPDRASNRGRRFAFAAAGAVSLAAFALGGALGSAGTAGSTLAAGGTTVAGVERGERQSRSDRAPGAPVGPVSASTPLPTPLLSPTQSGAHPMTGGSAQQHGPMVVPVLATLPVLHPPLIRPLHLPARQPDLESLAVYGHAGLPSVSALSASPTATAAAPPPGR